MSLEYKLGKTYSGKYQQLRCSEDAKTIVKDLDMLGFGDCISFRRKNKDGSTFGSDWSLSNLGYFKELQSYTRLAEIPQKDMEKLAARMYELLFMKSKGDEIYNTQPKIDKTKPQYQKILEELTKLQETQKRLIASGKIVFPKISTEELTCQHLW